MSSIVTARVPSSTKRQADALLKQLGASHTNLVNAAYAYLLQNRQLPPVDLRQGDAPPTPIRLLLQEDILDEYLEPDHSATVGLDRLVSMAFFGDVELWASAHDVCAALDASPERMGTVLPLIHICPLDAAMVRSALVTGPRRFKNHLVLAIAQAIEADAIVTHNPQALQEVSYDVLTPSDIQQHLLRSRRVSFEEFSLA